MAVSATGWRGVLKTLGMKHAVDLGSTSIMIKKVHRRTSVTGVFWTGAVSGQLVHRIHAFTGHPTIFRSQKGLFHNCSLGSLKIKHK